MVELSEIAGRAGIAGGAGCLGWVAGRFGRALVGSLRRGVRAPPGWCETSVAVLWIATALRVGTGGLAPSAAMLPWLLGWWGTLLAVCDLRAARLPDALTGPAYPVAAVALAALAWWACAPALLGGALAGAAVFAGCYALVRLLAPASLGAGDVKLAGSLGAAVGAVSVPAVPVCVLAAAALTLVGAILARGRAVPHGPCMLAPAWLVTTLLPAAGR